MAIQSPHAGVTEIAVGKEWVMPGVAEDCSGYGMGHVGVTKICSGYGMGHAWCNQDLQWVWNGSCLVLPRFAVGTEWVMPGVT